MTLNTRNTSKIAAALAAITTVGLLPAAAMAAPPRGFVDENRRDSRRVERRDDWRNSSRNNSRDDRRNDRWEDRRDDRREDRWDNRRNDRREEADKRQDSKNQWRNFAIVGGAAAAYGVVKKNPLVGLLGAAGALYSLNQYEQDRKSQNADDRNRASFFSRPSFERDGHRYQRETITRNGERFYRFMER